MSNANANGNGGDKPNFSFMTFSKQYLDSTLKQEIDRYVKDWENYKKYVNEEGYYIEFEEAYIGEYKKIKKICPMSEYKKEINDLNKSSDLKKSNVNENASVSPEDNVVLTSKNEEKDEEEEEIIEIKVEEEAEEDNNENNKESIKEKESNGENEKIVEKAIKRITGDEINTIIKEDNGEEKEEIKKETIEMKENNDENQVSIEENNSSEVEKNSETEDKNALKKSDANEDGFVYLRNNPADIEVELKDEDKDKDKDKKEIEKNLEDITMSSFKGEVHQKEMDDLNKTNALNKSNVSKDKDHKENDNCEKKQDEEEIEKNLEDITMSSFKGEVHQKEMDDLNKTNVLNKSNTSDDEDHQENDNCEKKQAENNIDKNQKKKIQDSNTTIDISKMVDNSSDFDSFCSALKEKGVAFNQIDFSKEPLGFLNCFRAFFSILFSRPKVNCGFWNLVYLKVSYEFVKSNGKSFCFEAHKAQNESNIDWLSSLINKAKQQASEEAGIDVNNRNPDKQQLH